MVLPGKLVQVYVPYVPAAPCIYDAEAQSWRKWLFDYFHEGLLNGHRPEDQTFHLIKPSAY